MKINLKITTKCPANCLCCSERLANFEKINNKEENIEKVFGKIIELYKIVGDKENHLSITGGEPTLVEKLSEVVNKASENNISVGVDTNGWNIDFNWLKKMEDAGLKYILLSVYSLDYDTYSYLRGTQNEHLFKRMKQALSVMHEYKKMGGRIEIRIQTVLMRQNYKELPRLLELVMHSKFDALSTAYYISLKPDENLLMNQDDIRNFIEQIEPQMVSVMKKYNLEENLLRINEQKIHCFFKFDNMPVSSIEQGTYRGDKKNCGETNRLAIYPNGIVVPCLGFDYNMETKYARNILVDEDFKFIINNGFREFWSEEYIMCSRCSNGYQVWLNFKK